MEYMLPQNRWHGDQPVKIDIPDSWETHYAEMEGDKLTVLTKEQLEDKISNPVYGPDNRGNRRRKGVRLHTV